MTRKKNTMVALAVVAILIGASMMPLFWEEPEDVEANPLPAVGAALAVGPGGMVLIGGAVAAAFAVGFILGHHFKNLPASNDPIYQAQLREAWGQLLASEGAQAENIFVVLLPTDAEMVGFTADHFMRVQEYSVADSWTLMGDYEANPLMAGNGTATNYANYLHNWQSVMSAAYNSVWEHEAALGGQSTYDSVKLDLMMNGTKINVDRPSAATTMTWLTSATPTVGADTVYVMPQSPDGGPAENGGNIMYLVGASGRMTDKNGVSYDLIAGKNDIGHIAPGYYQLSPGAEYIGPMTKAGRSAASVSAAILVESGPITKIIRVNGGTLSVDNTSVSTLDWEFSYKDQLGEKHVLNASPGVTMKDVAIGYGQMVDKIGIAIDKVAIAGQILWDLYDVAETSVDSEGKKVFISPSSIAPQASNVSLTPEMSKKLTAMALRQAADYYSSNRTALDGMEINVSLDSQELLCYGDIYRNGTLYAQDVVFSPYAYERDYTFSHGKNKWDQAGLAYIFGATDNFDGYIAPPSSMAMLPLDNSMDLEIKGIKSKGNAVETFKIEMDKVYYREGKKVEVTPPPPPPKPLTSDHSILIVIILLEAAALLGIMAYVTRMPVFVVAAAAAAVLGLVASGWIWDVYTGQVGFWDWLPKWRLF